MIIIIVIKIALIMKITMIAIMIIVISSRMQNNLRIIKTLMNHKMSHLFLMINMYREIINDQVLKKHFFHHEEDTIVQEVYVL